MIISMHEDLNTNLQTWLKQDSARLKRTETETALA
jgi:hypothetical protein